MAAIFPYLCWNSLSLVIGDSEVLCIDWKSCEGYPWSGNRIVDDHVKLRGRKQSELEVITLGIKQTYILIQCRQNNHGEKTKMSCIF